MLNFTISLSRIPGLIYFIENGKVEDLYSQYYIAQEYTTKNNEQYTILQYDKDFIYLSNISSYGLLRSVILSGSDVVCFSPPKSTPSDVFIKNYPEKTSAIVAEEFVEGTMINVFYDFKHKCWQIATRKTVGCDVRFYTHSTKTFSTMFQEACTAANLSIDKLNPFFCYSFVLQHPENRIVVPHKTPQLYLVATYMIIHDKQNNEINVTHISKYFESLFDAYHIFKTTGVKFPQKYEFETYSDLINQYASANTSYDIMGVVITNHSTGERTKIRNPIYEEVRQLRGNQPKLQYQYLYLRHTGKLPEFLKYYPETKKDMSKFREQVHMFTNTLHQNYLSCYVKKEKPLHQFSGQYKSHMRALHTLYIDEFMEKKLPITLYVVINYVNNLPPSRLMYSLNHNLKKKLVDTIVTLSSLA
jgi:hypothetical protein